MEQIELIKSKIYEIRGQKVMLDRDLAQMYGVETKALKQSIKRNITRFPSDFMFELTPEEFESLRSQIVTSKGRGGTRYMPYVFTEQGVAMLSSVLNSELAININIGIIRAFVAIRHSLPPTSVDQISELKTELNSLKEYIEEVFTDYNDINDDTRMQLELINETLAKLQTEGRGLPKNRRLIGFNRDDTHASE